MSENFPDEAKLVAGLFANLGATDPSVARVSNSSTEQLLGPALQEFRTGLPDLDAKALRTAVANRSVTATTYTADRQTLEESVSNRAHITGGGTRAENRRLERAWRRDNRHMDVRMDSEQYFTWLNQITIAKDKGLFRSPVLEILTFPVQLKYAPDLPVDLPPTNMLSALTPRDAQILYGEDPVPETATIAEISQKLRALNIADVSTEAFDRQFQTYLSIVDVETSMLLVEDLAEMASAGRKRAQRAHTLYAKYKESLDTISLASRQAAYKEVAEAFHRFARNSDQGSRVQRMYQLLAERADNTLGDLTALFTHTQAAYANRGLDLPPQLAGIDIDPIVPPPQETSEPIIAEEAEVAVRGAAAEVTEEEVMRRMRRIGYDQLAEVILPIARGTEVSGRLKEEFKQAIERTLEPKEATVMWERLNDLMDIGEMFGGELSRSKGLGNKLYFSLLFMVGDYLVTIAESPKEEFATYVFVENDASEESASEVFLFKRREAQQFGARAIVHTAQQPHGAGHVERIIKCFTDWIAELENQKNR